MSKVRENLVALTTYIQAMNCALDKADAGSNCEDMYFTEKLEKMASRLGYNLVKKTE